MNDESVIMQTRLQSYTEGREIKKINLFIINKIWFGVLFKDNINSKLLNHSKKELS